MKFKRKIVLASGSPRRQYLLTEANLDFRVIKPIIEEKIIPGIPIEELACKLARQKGRSCIDKIETDEMLISADTLVGMDGSALGKPNDISEARFFLRTLSSKTHDVYTGVFLADHVKEDWFFAHTRVTFYPLNDQEIEYYLESFEPYDKAGSYGIQEWIGWCKVKAILGSYSNIMGLPMAMLYHRLLKF